jgi:hypothetical protein
MIFILVKKKKIFFCFGILGRIKLLFVYFFMRMWKNPLKLGTLIYEIFVWQWVAGVVVVGRARWMREVLWSKVREGRSDMVYVMHDRIYRVIGSNGKNTTWPWWENSVVPHAKCHRTLPWTFVFLVQKKTRFSIVIYFLICLESNNTVRKYSNDD